MVKLKCVRGGQPCTKTTSIFSLSLGRARTGMRAPRFAEGAGGEAAAPCPPWRGDHPPQLTLNTPRRRQARRKRRLPSFPSPRDRSAGPRVNDVWQRSIKSGMAIGLYSAVRAGGEHALGVPLDHGGGGESVVSDASRPSEPPRAHDLGPGAGGVLAIAAGAVRVFCRRVVPITATATDRTNSLASPRRRSRGFRHFFSSTNSTTTWF